VISLSRFLSLCICRPTLRIMTRAIRAVAVRESTAIAYRCCFWNLRLNSVHFNWWICICLALVFTRRGLCAMRSQTERTQDTSIVACRPSAVVWSGLTRHMAVRLSQMMSSERLTDPTESDDCYWCTATTQLVQRLSTPMIVWEWSTMQHVDCDLLRWVDRDTVTPWLRVCDSLLVDLDSTTSSGYSGTPTSAAIR